MDRSGLYDQGYIVNFKEGDQAIYRMPLAYRSSVRDKYHVIKENETLHSIAHTYYGSSYKWFILADVNDTISDVFNLTVGSTIVIPTISIQ